MLFPDCQFLAANAKMKSERSGLPQLLWVDNWVDHSVDLQSESGIYESVCFRFIMSSVLLTHWQWRWHEYWVGMWTKLSVAVITMLHRDSGFKRKSGIKVCCSAVVMLRQFSPVPMAVAASLCESASKMLPCRSWFFFQVIRAGNSTSNAFFMFRLTGQLFLLIRSPFFRWLHSKWIPTQQEDSFENYPGKRKSWRLQIVFEYLGSILSCVFCA